MLYPPPPLMHAISPTNVAADRALSPVCASPPWVYAPWFMRANAYIAPFPRINDSERAERLFKNNYFLKISTPSIRNKYILQQDVLSSRRGYFILFY